jgi:hypothetical protein
LPSLMMELSNPVGEPPPRRIWPLRLGIALLGLSILYRALQYGRAVPGRPLSSDQRYFPGQTDSGVPQGLSTALEAMGEPSLWKISRCGRDAVYRFLCVPSSIGRAFAVRITKTGDGAELRVIELADELGSQSNRVKTEQKVSLSLLQWADLDTLAERSGFWGMASRDDRIISDGTALIVEGVWVALYHGVHRQSPPPGPYRSLCLWSIND